MIYKVPPCPGIYCFWNTFNNKCYIGSTLNLHTRIVNNHIKGNNSNPHLQKAIKKYGLSAFKITFWALESLNEAKNAEQYLLNYSFATKIILYNLSNSSRGGYLGPEVETKRLQSIRTIENRAKLSKATQGVNNHRCKTNPDLIHKAIQKYLEAEYKSFPQFKECLDSSISYKIAQSIYYGWNWRSITKKYPEFCQNPYKHSDVYNEP